MKKILIQKSVTKHQDGTITWHKLEPFVETAEGDRVGSAYMIGILGNCVFKYNPELMFDAELRRKQPTAAQVWVETDAELILSNVASAPPFKSEAGKKSIHVLEARLCLNVKNHNTESKVLSVWEPGKDPVYCQTLEILGPSLYMCDAVNHSAWLETYSDIKVLS